MVVRARVAYTRSTYDAVIAGLFVAPSAVDVERVDLAAPLHRLLELPLGVVHVPLSSLQKPHQPVRTGHQLSVNLTIAVGTFLLIDYLAHSIGP